MKHFKIISAIIFLALNLRAQEREETIYMEITPENESFSTLWIDNISGSIHVETHKLDFIQLAVKKLITAESTVDLNTGWQKIDPVILRKDDTVEVYLKGFCECDCDKDDSHYGHRCDDKDHNFDFRFDFNVKVPAELNLRLSTINNGEIKVTGTYGKLKVNNVNGGIVLEDIAGATEAKTINGDVTVRYLKNPVENSRYYTLNGTLSVFYLPDLSADISMKSFNGEFYTEFDITEFLPSQLVANKDRKNGATWQIENSTSVRIGKGDISLDMETFNGDIYVRSRKSGAQR